MSLITAKQNFQKAFKDENKTLTEKFLAELKKYVEARKKQRRYKEILECMDNNKPLASFLCRNDICDDLVVEMLNRQIPFVLVTNREGDYGFIIRSSDRALTNEAIKVVLRRLGSYCEIVTGDELINIVQKMRDRDKGLLAINGLSLKEMRLLEKICRKKGFLEFIAQDKMSDGTYRFMVYGKQAAKDNLIAISLLEMIMAMEGANKGMNGRRMNNELAVDDLRDSNFGRNKSGFKTIFIVGSGKQYMKIEQDGFSYGNAVRKGEKIEFVEQYQQKIGTPGYNEYEISYLNRIPDPAATTDMNQVYEHMNNRNGRDSLDFGMNQRERDNAFGEALLIAGVMSVVIQNTAKDDIMNVSERWMEKTGHLTAEAGKVMTGLIKGETPIGYNDLDLRDLKNVIINYGLDMNNYTGVASTLNGVAITNERGSLELKGNVKDRIDEMHEQIQASDIGEIEYSESARESR